MKSSEVRVEPRRSSAAAPRARPFPGERHEPLDVPVAETSPAEKAEVLTRQTLGFLGWGVALLAVANLVNDAVGRPLWTVTRFIYLGADQNVSAWYSSILLLGAAALAGKCFLISRARSLIRPWSFALLAALLAAMSCDEIARFHETLGEFASRFYGDSTMEVSRHASWVWVGGPLIIGTFGFFVFLLQAPLRAVAGTARSIALGFALIVLGGVVLEATINWMNHDELQWLWNLEVVVEETLEMAGTLVIAYGLARWIETVKRRPESAPAAG